MAADFIEFMERQIGKKIVISGHSSGGMIATWMAAKYPEYILGTVIEDSPFFATEPGRREKTYVWKYEFQLYENYKNQNETKSYFTYYLENSYWKKMFGNFLWNRFSKDAIKYHEKHPDKPVHLFYLPPQINRLFETATYPYDKRFGETFYNNSWFEDYHQSTVLSEIKSPTVFVKAKTNYDGDLLLAALSDEDTDRIITLLENGKRIDINTPGHDIHYDKPKELTKILIDFLEVI